MWIDTAENGERAMALLQNEGRQYDLVLVEVELPGALSGYALCSWYKEACRRERRRSPPFVAVTADPDDETCRAFNIDRCLPKPLTSQCAKHALQEWLAQCMRERERTADAADADAERAADADANGGARPLRPPPLPRSGGMRVGGGDDDDGCDDGESASGSPPARRPVSPTTPLSPPRSLQKCGSRQDVGSAGVSSIAAAAKAPRTAAGAAAGGAAAGAAGGGAAGSAPDRRSVASAPRTAAAAAPGWAAAARDGPATAEGW